MEHKKEKEIESKVSKTKLYVASIFLNLFLSWIVSLFVNINPFLIFIIVQVITFTQAFIGGWLGKKMFN